VKVAPLTHGAKLRLGNTYGRFSEELPTEADAPPSGAVEPFAEEEMPFTTQPHEVVAADDLKKK